MRARSHRRRLEAMTLIEVMVVVLIMALAAVGISYGFGALTQANLRSGCMTLNAASRGAYARAVSQNTTVRLLFDFEENTMAFEEAHGRVVLTRTDDATRQELEDGEDGSVADPWAAAQARLSDTLRPTFGASPFSQIDGRRFQPRPLADGIQIATIIVPHEPDPVTEGQAAIYFFPGGRTEHAVVQLTDGDDRVYSVELHPLTGRGTVYDFAYEPDELLDDGHGGVRSEVER